MGPGESGGHQGVRERQCERGFLVGDLPGIEAVTCAARVLDTDEVRIITAQHLSEHLGHHVAHGGLHIPDVGVAGWCRDGLGCPADHLGADLIGLGGGGGDDVGDFPDTWQARVECLGVDPDGGVGDPTQGAVAGDPGLEFVQSCCV